MKKGAVKDQSASASGGAIGLLTAVVVPVRARVVVASAWPANGIRWRGRPRG